MLNLLLIAVIVVIIIDISGIIDSIKSSIKRVVTKGMMSDPNYAMKPLDCSFCMTFWTGLAYLLITHTLSLPMLAYLLGLCVLTPVIRDAVILVREALTYIIRKTYEAV